MRTYPDNTSLREIVNVTDLEFLELETELTKNNEDQNQQSNLPSLYENWEPKYPMTRLSESANIQKYGCPFWKKITHRQKISSLH